jgi:chemotaxis protein MotB
MKEGWVRGHFFILFVFGVCILVASCIPSTKRALVQDIEDRDAKIAELNTRVKELLSEVEDLKRENEVINTEAAELRAQVEQLKEIVSSKEVELKELSESYSGRQESLIREKEALEDRLSSISQERDTLDEENKALIDEIRGLREENNELERENQGLKDRVSSLQGDLELLKVEKEKALKRLKAENAEIKKALEEYIKRREVEVQEEGRGLVVTFINKVLFDTGQSIIKDAAIPTLDKVAEVIKRHKGRSILIEGHTDNVPIHTELFPSNWELSVRRATTVLKYLQFRHGISAKRLSAVGYGPYRPVAPNDTPEGRARNRRVEIIFLPEGFEREVQVLE